MTNKENLTNELREDLKKFPLYKENDAVDVYCENDGVCISYSLKDPKNPLNYFGLYIKGKNCDIYSPFIERIDNGEDYKFTLINIIEQFCQENFKCDTFTTIPSESSKKNGFWSELGFKYLNAIVVAKTYD